MSSPLKTLLQNIFANQIGFLVSVVVTFFLSPFVINSLGDTRYGIWTLIVSLTGNYGLLAFGIQGAVTRYIAYATATGDRERVNGYFNTTLSFLLISAALVIIIGLLVTLFIDLIFVVPKDLVDEAQGACALVTLSAAATFSFSVFDSVLIAHQRFRFINGVGIFTSLVRAGMTVLILKMGYGLVVLSAIGVGLTLFNGLLLAAAVKWNFSWIRFSLVLARRSYFKELINYGYKSFTVGIAVALVYQCDLLVIGTCLTPDKITTYSLASTLITYVIQFVIAVASPLGPYATGLCANDKSHELRTFFIQGSCLMYMLGGLVVAGCLVFGNDFFTLWVGVKFANSAVILSILVIPQFFVTGGRIGSSILIGTANIGPLAVAAICEGASNLMLSLILVHYYGIIGVAIGTVIPSLVNNGLWMPWYVSRFMKIKLGIYFMRAMFPGIVIGIIGVVFGSTLHNFMITLGWGTFVLSVCCVICCCFVIAVALFYSIHESSTLKKMIFNYLRIK